MISKKGEAVPILILAIGLLMLVYMYFLPLEEKCSLIPGLPDCKIEETEKILEFAPGLLEEQATAARYLLEDVQLFVRDEVDVDTVLENVETSKGWFSSSPKETVFMAQENAREAKLFVFVNKASGKLKVYVNKVKVGTVEGEGMHLISLNAKTLNETNLIKIVPTCPVLPFFTNRYEIAKIILKEEYTVTNNQVSVPFLIKEDPEDILDIRFSFRTRCFTEDNLSVKVADEKLIEDKICKGFEKDVTDIVMGNNMTGNITFASEGNYFIRDVMLDVRMAEKAWPTYYFSIKKERLEQPVTMRLEFNETGVKKITAYVNGNAIALETSKREWTTMINKYLNAGRNSILLIPERTVTVTKLEVG